jgi:CRP-like cAMP-binding protein
VSPYETVIARRRDQAFPVLNEADISRLERFGERRRYRRGERLFAAGERTPGMFVVLKGALTMTARDGLIPKLSKRDSGGIPESACV